MEKKYLKILNSVKNFETDDVLICVNLNDILKFHNQICSEDDFVKLCNFIDFCHQECSSFCYRLLAEIICDLYFDLKLGFRDSQEEVEVDTNLSIKKFLTEQDIILENNSSIWARKMVVGIFEDFEENLSDRF